jgi:tetratricopeptide (TPR) repeat protein
MRLHGSWLAAIGVGVTLALSPPCWAHQQIGLKLEQLDTEIAEHPIDADLYVQRGELYRLNREWALAEVDFRKAVGLKPDNPDLQFHLGRLWFEAGRPERARAALDRFVAARPNHVEGLVIRGRVLGALDEPLAAAADYDRVIARLDPPEPEHYLQRARWLIAEGDPHVDAALRGIDEAIARLGPLVTLVAFAIDVEAGRGRHDAALARVASLPSALADRPNWLVRRGDVLRAGGRDREALAAYAAALASIEGLSAKRRTVRATVALEMRLRRLLARDSVGAYGSPPDPVVVQ